jgi:hypothetical protein
MSILGLSKTSLFYFISDGPTEDAPSKNKIEFWRSPQLINMNNNRVYYR